MMNNNNNINHENKLIEIFFFSQPQNKLWMIEKCIKDDLKKIKYIPNYIPSIRSNQIFKDIILSN